MGQDQLKKTKCDKKPYSVHSRPVDLTIISWNFVRDIWILYMCAVLLFKYVSYGRLQTKKFENF